MSHLTKETKPVAAAVSIESLWHYRCGACNLWWTIGDPPEAARINVFCPHCGRFQPVAFEHGNVPDLLSEISTVDLEPEVAQVINENFWEMIGESDE